MRNQKTRFYYGMFLLMFLALGLGYAALTTNLSIDGVTNVTSTSWNVFFDNIREVPGSIVPDESASVSGTTSVTYEITLHQPGDYYDFFVDVVNDGTIDAMFDSITSKLNGVVISSTNPLPNYLEYSITYDSGATLARYQLLEAGATLTYRVRVAYKTDINPEDLPADDVTHTFSFDVIYVQADANAVSVVHPNIYSISLTPFTIGSGIPTGVPYYTNFLDAMDHLNHDAFIVHTMNNNVVTESKIGFLLQNKFYYLKGGIDESALGTKPVFDANKSVATAAFGSSNCTTYTNEYICNGTDVSVDISAYGDIVIMFGAVDAYCGVYGDATSFCEIINE